MKFCLFSAITFDSTQLCLNRIQYHSGIAFGTIHGNSHLIFFQSLSISNIPFAISRFSGVYCNNFALSSRQFADSQMTFFSLKSFLRYRRFSFPFHLKFANSFIKS